MAEAVVTSAGAPAAGLHPCPSCPRPCPAESGRVAGGRGDDFPVVV